MAALGPAPEYRFGPPPAAPPPPQRAYRQRPLPVEDRDSDSELDEAHALPPHRPFVLPYLEQPPAGGVFLESMEMISKTY